MKKFFTLLLVAILTLSLVFVIVSCKEEIKPTKEEAVEEEAVEEEAEREPVILEIWDPETRDQAVVAWDYLIEAFEAEYPYITIDVVNVGWGELYTKVQAALATDTLPDIIMSWAALPADLARIGVYAPITNVVEKIGEDQFPAELMKYYYSEGEHYAIPIATYPMILIYRNDVYEQLDLQPPTTWDEVLANSKAIADNTDMYGFGLYNAPPEPEVFECLMGLNDGAIVGEDGESITINSPEALEVLEYMQELYKYSSEDILAKGEQDTRTLMMEGIVGQMLTSTSIAGAFQAMEETSMSFTGVRFPTNKGNRGAITTPINYGITTTTENREESELLFEFMHRDDIAVEFHKLYIPGHIPTFKKVNDSEDFWNSPNVQEFINITQAGVEANDIAILPAAELGPNALAGIITGTGILEEMVNKMLLEGQSPQEVLDWAEQEINNAIE